MGLEKNIQNTQKNQKNQKNKSELNPNSGEKIIREMVALPIGPKISFYLEKGKVILERNDDLLRKYSELHGVNYNVEDIVLSNNLQNSMEIILKFNINVIEKISFIYEPQGAKLFVNEIILKTDNEDCSYVLLDPDATKFLVDRLKERVSNFKHLDDLRIEPSKTIDIEEPSFPYGLVNSTPIVKTLVINPNTWEIVTISL